MRSRMIEERDTYLSLQSYQKLENILKDRRFIHPAQFPFIFLTILPKIPPLSFFVPLE